MTYMRGLTLLAAAVALAACSTDPNRFGDGDGGVGTDSAFGADGFAGAGDPSSPIYFSQTIGDRVLFVVDTSTLTSEAQTVLAGQADWLTTNPEFTAIIEGHADERGTREYNLALGARRASAVQDFLVSRGVAPGRLRTVTYGKERPLEICSDEACYSQNRRAVTVITAGLAG